MRESMAISFVYEWQHMSQVLSRVQDMPWVSILERPYFALIKFPLLFLNFYLFLAPLVPSSKHGVFSPHNRNFSEESQKNHGNWIAQYFFW